MKSKKARFLIRKGEFTYIGYAGCKYTDNRAISKNAALDAVKIAEQEAEERMRENAIEAFCASNCPKGCSFGADGNIGCGAKARFIQKMYEE